MQVAIIVDVKNREELRELERRLKVDYSDELIETELTREEKKQLKDYLYRSLMFLATERPEFRPRKKDSIQQMLESYFFWASEFNDNYMPEMKDTDNIAKYMVEQFEYWYR